MEVLRRTSVLVLSPFGKNGRRSSKLSKDGSKASKDDEPAVPAEKKEDPHHANPHTSTERKPSGSFFRLFKSKAADGGNDIEQTEEFQMMLTALVAFLRTECGAEAYLGENEIYAYARKFVLRGQFASVEEFSLLSAQDLQQRFDVPCFVAHRMAASSKEPHSWMVSATEMVPSRHNSKTMSSNSQPQQQQVTMMMNSNSNVSMKPAQSGEHARIKVRNSVGAVSSGAGSTALQISDSEKSLLQQHAQ